MTTVAASVKHRQIAADSKCSDDGYHYQVSKLRTYDSIARAAAGDWNNCLKFHDAMESGGDLDDDLDIEAIELRHDGIYVYEGKIAAKIKDKYYAIGSGAAYAIAGMRLGLTPEEAVILAAEFDPATGGQIDVWSLPEKPITKPRVRKR